MKKILLLIFVLSTGYVSQVFGDVLKIQVIDDNDKPLQYVKVQIRDITGKMVYGGETRSDGWIEYDGADIDEIYLVHLSLIGYESITYKITKVMFKVLKLHGTGIIITPLKNVTYLSTKMMLSKFEAVLDRKVCLAGVWC